MILLTVIQEFSVVGYMFQVLGSLLKVLGSLFSVIVESGVGNLVERGKRKARTCLKGKWKSLERGEWREDGHDVLKRRVEISGKRGEGRGLV